MNDFESYGGRADHRGAPDRRSDRPARGACRPRRHWRAQFHRTDDNRRQRRHRRPHRAVVEPDRRSEPGRLRTLQRQDFVQFGTDHGRIDHRPLQASARSGDVQLGLHLSAFEGFFNAFPPFDTASNLLSSDLTAIAQTRGKERSVSQEFRFVSDYDSPLNCRRGRVFPGHEGRPRPRWSPVTAMPISPKRDRPKSSAARRASIRASSRVSWS